MFVVFGVFVVIVLFVFDFGFDGVDFDEFVDDVFVIELVMFNVNVNGVVVDGGDDVDLVDYDVLVDDVNEIDDDFELGYGYFGEEELCVFWL